MMPVVELWGRYNIPEESKIDPNISVDGDSLYTYEYDIRIQCRF